MGEIGQVNWLAVVAGFVLSFLLGWAWYSPALFGKKWAEGKGVNLGSSKEMPVAAMVTQAAGTFLLAWVIGVALAANALPLAVLVVAAFVLLLVANGLFGLLTAYAIATEAGFVAVMAAIMVLMHTVL